MTAAYGLTIFISLLAASSELFSKFKDEPFKVLSKHRISWFYLFFNASISSLSLYMLLKTSLFGTILMRSKLIKVNIDGKEVAVGPEMIINVYPQIHHLILDYNKII